jgi:hypothetical protein
MLILVEFGDCQFPGKHLRESVTLHVAETIEFQQRDIMSRKLILFDVDGTLTVPRKVSPNHRYSIP